MIFDNRVDAGRRLAGRLREYDARESVVLAIPRGGVVVGYEVAAALGAPLDVIIPRKIGAPGQPELAIGAVAGESITVLDEQAVCHLGVSESYINEEAARQRKEIARRRDVYRLGRPFPSLRDKSVLLVDDGIATGATITAAAREARSQGPSTVAIAVPVAPPDAVLRLRDEVDDMIVIETPEPFYAVGSWYYHFEQTTDEEVIGLLRAAESWLYGG